MPDVLMPRLSDTMTEGVVSQWLMSEGDEVHRGDVLAEIETDKATMDLEAYDSGPLTRIIVEAGTTVPIGAPVAVIGEPGEASSSGSRGEESGDGQGESDSGRGDSTTAPPSGASSAASTTRGRAGRRGSHG